MKNESRDINTIERSPFSDKKSLEHICSQSEAGLHLLGKKGRSIKGGPERNSRAQRKKEEVTWKEKTGLPQS